MDKKISVIVPVYNSINCLERCVDSICRQTYRELEILLIDDGSTDGTGALCDALAGKDKRIRVFHKKNGGASSACNLGIENATGDFFGFVDSDDYIEPYVYERMIEVFLGQEDDKKTGEEISIVQISRDEVDEDGTKLPDVCIPPKEITLCRAEDFLKELLLHRGDCSFCTKLVRRELFRQHRFPKGELNEDFRLLTELLQEKEDSGQLLPSVSGHCAERRSYADTGRWEISAASCLRGAVWPVSAIRLYAPCADFHDDGAE